jgi:hypothetical protein
VELRAQDFDPEEWQILVGTWSIEAHHEMLPGDEIRGEMTVEWLDGDRLLIQRSHYDHADIPDAISVLGVIDNELAMHYYDSRGVHRAYTLSLVGGTLRYAMNAPEFSQRLTLVVSGDGNTMTGQAELSRDGSNWKDDMALTYRRANG